LRADRISISTRNAFLAPATGTYGNVGRDTLIGPGLARLDVSFSKNTALSEKLRLQFRAELFNILNRANFGTPNAVVFSSASSTPAPSDHHHFDHIPADPIWIETAVVIAGRRAPLIAYACAARVRAAFRAARLNPALPFVRTAFSAACLRLAAPRIRALARAWRASAARDADCFPSR